VEVVFWCLRSDHFLGNLVFQLRGSICSIVTGPLSVSEQFIGKVYKQKEQSYL